jgi:hypothetical protein
MMKEANLLKRIEQLEARIRELEARPTQHNHHHYNTVYGPMQPPLVTWTLPHKAPPWEVTCYSLDSSGHQQ